MRWNCPHCEELVTADIDFENSKPSYVRCGKCEGLALIQRNPTARATPPSVVIPPPPKRVIDAVEPAIETVVSPPLFTAPVPTPTFTYSYAKPPAFLTTVDSSGDSMERAFAAEEEKEETSIPEIEFTATKAIAPNSRRPMMALWAAAALALSSGYYLYQEGRKVIASATRADEIRSKANSAVRLETRPQVVVRVPRAILRNAPSMEGTLVQTLDRATTATYIEDKMGWIRVESPQISTPDRTAWVRADLVTRTPN